MTDISPEAMEREYLEAIEIMGADLKEVMLDEGGSDPLARIFILGQGDYPTGHDIIKSTANEVRKLRARVAELEAAGEWQSIETAPRDGTQVLAVCVNNCSGPCAYTDTDPSGRLCLYHAHAEGLSHTDDGFALIQWGGGWSDTWEDGGGCMPDFWFVCGTEFEQVANPTHWMPLPSPPKETPHD